MNYKKTTVFKFFQDLELNTQTYHWLTESYSRHIGSDKLFKNILETGDKFIEVYIGRYGRPNFTQDTIVVKKMSDSEFVIFDTSKFLKLVGICNQFLTMDIQLEGKIATKLLLADSEYNLEYALANLMLAPNVNFTVSEFESDYEFTIDNEFINTWVKAKKALNSDTTIIKAYTNEDGEPKVNFTLGEPEGHSNKIQFEVPLTSLAVDSTTLKFNADYLKAIFDANYGAVGNAYISNDGAMKLDFMTEDFQQSSYIILAKI